VEDRKRRQTHPDRHAGFMNSSPLAQLRDF